MHTNESEIFGDDLYAAVLKVRSMMHMMNVM